MVKRQWVGLKSTPDVALRLIRITSCILLLIVKRSIAIALENRFRIPYCTEPYNCVYGIPSVSKNEVATATDKSGVTGPSRSGYCHRPVSRPATN